MGGPLPPQRTLLVLFLITLPLVNPWVRGDGVGYYAYVRSLLIDGDLRFENEFLAGNSTFVLPKLDETGRLHRSVFTSTGYVDNHFTVGPALLWAPFLLVTHGTVKVLNLLGLETPADGYSRPYLWTMAIATALYGYWGLLLSFRLARQYFSQEWAFLATVGIWFGSSLPVYMYFNPSWSHAHSAFAVALFLWYWHRTRGPRSPLQWILLGLLGGLMMNVYYPNALVLLVPLVESLHSYWRRWRENSHRGAAVGRLAVGNLLSLVALTIAMLPTLITRWIIYGNPLQTGYRPVAEWNWAHPELWNVLFSSNHGLLTWTPILALSLAGLFLLRRMDGELALSLALVFLAFYYLIASHLSWHGIGSYGNRFFVSLTPLFVLGLAAALAPLQKLGPRPGTAVARGVLGLFILWNAGLMFQWGTHLIPPRGPISWREAARNQVTVVPVKVWGSVRRYLTSRQAMMKDIERKDAQKLFSEPPGSR